MQNVLSTGDENTSAAGLAPDVLVACAGRAVVVVAGEELALVDPQLTVKEMQFFYSCVSMRWITRSGCEAHKHADPLPFRVRREQLAFDAGGDLFPFRLRPLTCGRNHWFLANFIGKA